MQNIHPCSLDIVVGFKRNVLVPELRRRNSGTLDGIFYMQDGAPPHTAGRVIRYLGKKNLVTLAPYLSNSFFNLSVPASFWYHND